MGRFGKRNATKLREILQDHIDRCDDPDCHVKRFARFSDESLAKYGKEEALNLGITMKHHPTLDTKKRHPLT